MATRRSKKAAPEPSPDPAPAAAPVVVAPPADLVRRAGRPCDPGLAEPLRIVAHLQGSIVTVPALDAMLAALVATVEGLPPVQTGDTYADIDIPILREPGGRFHLASAPIFREERYEMRHRNRRFPMTEAQMLGGADLRRVNVQNGATKSFRVPYQKTHLVDDRVLWYCQGDRKRIAWLLQTTDYLGRQRGVGAGRVVRWQVESVEEPWPGFPVLLDGQPLRPLPLDWPGVTCAVRRLARLSYPYWETIGRVPCLTPEAS